MNIAFAGRAERAATFLQKRLRGIDLLILLLALFTAASLFRRATDSGSPPPSLIRPASTLSLPGVNWGAAERHVVLLVTTTCSVCQQSAEFYQELSELVSKLSDVRLIIASPQPPGELEEWLRSRMIRPAQAVQVTNPVALGFTVVPTLLFVDHSGTVTDIMMRGLAPRERENVLSRASNQGGIGPLDNTDYAREVDSRELTSMLERPEGLTILDVRDREFYERAHVAGAINIPFEELPTRGQVEIPSERPLVIVCSGDSATKCRAAARMLRSLRVPGVSINFDRR